jgi:hypothetical protein
MYKEFPLPTCGDDDNEEIWVVSLGGGNCRLFKSETAANIFASYLNKRIANEAAKIEGIIKDADDLANLDILEKSTERLKLVNERIEALREKSQSDNDLELIYDANVKYIEARPRRAQ